MYYITYNVQFIRIYTCWIRCRHRFISSLWQRIYDINTWLPLNLMLMKKVYLTIEILSARLFTVFWKLHSKSKSIRYTTTECVVDIRHRHLQTNSKVTRTLLRYSTSDKDIVTYLYLVGIDNLTSQRPVFSYMILSLYREWKKV